MEDEARGRQHERVCDSCRRYAAIGIVNIAGEGRSPFEHPQTQFAVNPFGKLAKTLGFPDCPECEMAVVPLILAEGREKSPTEAAPANRERFRLRALAYQRRSRRRNLWIRPVASLTMPEVRL